MEKIKSVLHGHKKSEDVAAHDPQTSSSATDNQTHPIYDQMSTPGQPHYNIKTTSGEPYTTLAQPGDSAGLHGKQEYAGANAPTHSTATTAGHDNIGHSSTATGYNDNNQSTNHTHAKDGGNASIVPLKVQEKLPESVERAVPNAVHDTGDKKHDHSSNPTSTSGAHLSRPDVQPTGHSTNTEMSTASIKSGVIGFGPSGGQEHAAISTHNPAEHSLTQDQVVAGGIPNTAGRTEGQSSLSSTGAQPGSQNAATGSNLGAINERQPYDNTLRQESYTADTNRSFPLAGGVTSQSHEPLSSTRHATDHTSTTQHSTEPTSTLHQTSIPEREPGTKDQEAGVREGHGREALAGAAAAATAVGVAQSGNRSESRDVHGQTSTSAVPVAGHSDSHKTENEGILAKAKNLIGLGSSKEHGHTTDTLGSRSATHGDVPFNTATTGSATDRTAQGHNPDALAAALAASGLKSSHQSASAPGQSFGSDDSNLAGTGLNTGTSNPVSGSVTSERPHASRLESHQIHVPGAFVQTPGEHGNTFLDYTSVVGPPSVSGAGGPALGAQQTPITGASTGVHSTAQPTSTFDSSAGLHSGSGPVSATGDHELRHTGTLDEPLPRSSDDHHHVRDAGAIAGGLGAGAGLGAYAASKKHDTSDTGASKPLYEESSPYSSKTIDPRVLGTNANLEGQRFDPQTKSVTSPHQLTSGTGSSATTAPSATSTTATTGDSQHHYGRDAALVGAGGATGAALHHSLQRNDTPGTGNTVLPQESHSSSVPSSTVPHQSSNFSAPLTSSTQQPSTGSNTFYGAAGAPAPVSHHTTQNQQPASTVGQSSTSGTTAVPEKEPEHHYGRNAGLAGAGLAGAGGLYAATHDGDKGTAPPSNAGLSSSAAPASQSGLASSTGLASDTGPASKTIGPHSSNIANVLDPRVKPDPTLQKSSTTTGAHQGQQSEHHLGRDAAIVGGTGAAGYGVHEAAESYDQHRLTQPAASMNEQRYDPTANGAKAPSPIAGKSEYNYNDPAVQSNLNRTDPNTESHTGRNVALGTGAGLAAAGVGAGAYASSKHDDHSQQLPLHQKQGLTSSTQPGFVAQSSYPTQSSASYPTQSTVQTSYPTQGTVAPQHTLAQTSATQPPHDATRDPSDQSHDKRNAALLGAGGAAALGGGAYALSQQDERERARLAEREQERLKKEAHDREKEQHKLDKEQHKHDKEVHKHDKAVAAHEKDQHHLQKEQEKEQHRLAKEQRLREKEAEKEAHRREKETGEEEKKKKGGLLGFLHRDKSKKERSANSPDSSPRQSRESPRHSREYAAGAGALGAGAAGAAYDENHPDHPRWKGKTLLQKDPPKGHPAREALEHHNEGDFGGKREHIGVDGPIGHPDLISGDRQTSKGVFGAHPTSEIKHSHVVTEPHTGLPMNVGKYGAGTGGLEGHPSISGHHAHDTIPGQTGTDANVVRKNDGTY